jgi:hypothetical protein
MPEPAEPEAQFLQRCNALRELRGALHGAAVLTVGLRPVEAIAARVRNVSDVYGWPEPYPDPTPLLERWKLAEARTDRMVGRSYAALDEPERAELVDRLGAVRAALP